MRARLALLLLALLCRPAAADRAHVYLVVVDGLDARLVTAERMPRLFEALGKELERSSVFPASHAVLPTCTNPNHVTLLTGAYPQAHGITGNAYWTRVAGEAPRRLDDPALIEVQTLFTVAEETHPELNTVGVFAKGKVARLFSAVPGRQHAPDRVWTDEEVLRGPEPDAATMTHAVALMEQPEPDLAVIALAGVDRTAHAHGPDGPDVDHAVRAADAAIGQLIDHLHQLGRWGRSVLIVTADHGFDAVAPTAERPYPLVTFGRDLLAAGVRGVRLVDDGRLEHVYLERLDAAATDAGAGAATLARVAEVARHAPGIGEVVARLPVAGVPTLATAHPDWHLEHPRVGELLLVAARGHHFVDPFDPTDAALLGAHGSADEGNVPLVVTGGAPQITAASAGAPQPASVAVAPTIAALLELPAPRRVDGGDVPAELAGRPLAAVLIARP